MGIKAVKKTLLLFSIIILSACASSPQGIGTHVNLCCVNQDYKTFTVKAVDIPAFLGPLMVSNFSVALATKGLQPLMQNADLDVVLRYVQTDLTKEKIRDDFNEPLLPGGEVHFIAKIVVDIKEAKSGKMLWSGSIQRSHNISPGEFMHTGRASISLLNAFNKLLTDFFVETQ